MNLINMDFEDQKHVWETVLDLSHLNLTPCSEEAIDLELRLAEWFQKYRNLPTAMPENKTWSNRM